MDQSKVQTSICKKREAREIVCQRAMLLLSFWLDDKVARDFKPIVYHDNAKPKQINEKCPNLTIWSTCSLLKPELLHVWVTLMSKRKQAKDI